MVAVDDISFSIAPGEVLGVVGESGAGKSLTGAGIIGLLARTGRIAGGEIRLAGLRIDTLPYEQMRKVRGREIGAIFQEPADVAKSAVPLRLSGADRPAFATVRWKGATMKLLATALAGIGLFVVQMAWAGPYDEPYGKIEIGDRSVNRKHEPAAINKIDGKSTDNPRRPDPVSPGKHAVEISFSSARVVIGDQLKTIEIDVKPCKRYRVVAHYTTSGKWEPVVQSVEDIGECKKKFLQSTAAK